MVSRPTLTNLDLYVGTSPCQDFSAAGKGRGVLAIFIDGMYRISCVSVCLIDCVSVEQGTSGKEGNLWWHQLEHILSDRPRATCLALHTCHAGLARITQLSRLF